MSTTAAFGDPAAAVGRRLGPWRPRGRLQAYSGFVIASFACYILGRLIGGGSTVFSVIGAGACGWSWLLARALFDPAEQDARWPRILALIVAATGALSVLAPTLGMVSRIADNGYALSGSAALMLTFVEPFHRYRHDLSAAEKRFRLLFLAAHTLLVAVSILGLRATGDGADAAFRDNLVKSGCAVAGVAAAMASVWFRLRHPLAQEERPSPRRAPTADETRLAERLLRLLQECQIEREPDLRISDVAARLGEPEYRVSQSIRVGLGFANFNRLINHHRVERAKRLLADPNERRSILEVAFDCGFGSLGPFNRSFRDEVGVTPRAYRAEGRRHTAEATPSAGDHCDERN